MNRKRLIELMDRFQELRIAVAGDLFLDRWYEVDVGLNEPSIETGLTAYQIVKKRAAAGAAGTVINTLSELGVGQLSVVSLVGNDGDGWEMCKLLRERRVDTSGIIVSDEVVTPSYIKPRFPEEGNRYDIKNFRPTPLAIQEQIIANVEHALRNVDALILLDQICEPNTGVLTEKVRNVICAMADRYPDKLIFADSRAFIDKFTRVVIKCNNFEAAKMTGRRADEQTFDAGLTYACMDDLEKQTGKPVVITRNANGIAVRQEGEQRVVPAVRHKGEIDICGAGDACTAGLVMTLCAGGSYAEAAFVGNLTAGVTVRKIGCTGTASQQELRDLYDEQWG